MVGGKVAVEAGAAMTPGQARMPSEMFRRCGHSAVRLWLAKFRKQEDGALNEEVSAKCDTGADDARNSVAQNRATSEPRKLKAVGKCHEMLQDEKERDNDNEL